MTHASSIFRRTVLFTMVLLFAFSSQATWAVGISAGSNPAGSGTTTNVGCTSVTINDGSGMEDSENWDWGHPFSLSGLFCDLSATVTWDPGAGVWTKVLDPIITNESAIVIHEQITIGGTAGSPEWNSWTESLVSPTPGGWVWLGGKVKLGTTILDFPGQGLLTTDILFTFASQPVGTTIDIWKAAVCLANCGGGPVTIQQYPGVVPVPAAVWLFGSALGLLGWMRRSGIRTSS